MVVSSIPDVFQILVLAPQREFELRLSLVKSMKNVNLNYVPDLEALKKRLALQEIHLLLLDLSFLSMDITRFCEMMMMDFPNLVTLVIVQNQDRFMDIYSPLEQGLIHFYIFKDASPLEYRLNVKNGIKKIYDMVLNQELIYKVKSYNLQLVSDVEQKENKLKALHQERSRYLNFLIHELKGPLSSAKAFLELVLAGELTSDEEMNFLSLAVFNTEEMLRMINCLLDYARSDEFGIELNPGPFKIVEFFQKIANMFGVIARNKNLELKVEFPFEDFLIEVDAEKFEMAVSNVVSNAIKYTDQGQVKLSCQKEGDFLRIEIADTGRGIEKEELESIFEAYQRGRRTNDIQGTGLGLAFTRKIIEAHHGVINVLSEGAAKGSLFQISVPL